ncbi:hypothetical protein GUITHDRAFT_111458 [Guillardia theta CCMP2712]|uniref:Uncharacterized protein n=1 Tax=Guillardia theta (strain CCMP2712) TaxID=905079 RepID=L1J1U4_GUITC|nr:hypothetical protein GUITHDRAFT_111458 [Guillardia theta CCMP2712]EKX42486.1 hypothetical protein GUITHDRAFT_111458 [Guillardia theta CCMP2712]|eukprot:XP_005829466.1 hypothetical protein GUITHDRAFT_111458 [Guillardia theta CCMP2712]
MTTGSSDTAADPESPKEPSDPFLARAQKMLGSNSEKVTEVAFWMLQKQTELELVETQLRYYKENNNVLMKKAKQAHELELRNKIQNEESYFKYILSYPTQRCLLQHLFDRVAFNVNLSDEEISRLFDASNVPREGWGLLDYETLPMERIYRMLQSQDLRREMWRRLGLNEDMELPDFTTTGHLHGNLPGDEFFWTPGNFVYLDKNASEVEKRFFREVCNKFDRYLDVFDIDRVPLGELILESKARACSQAAQDSAAVTSKAEPE